MRLTLLVERIERLLDGRRRHRVRAVLLRIRRPNLDQNVVAGPVRIGMGAVKMDIPGARSMEAVGKVVEQIVLRIRRAGDQPRVVPVRLIAPLPARLLYEVHVGSGMRGPHFDVLIDRGAEIGWIDLVQECQLHDIADAGAQRWPRQGSGVAALSFTAALAW